MGDPEGLGIKEFAEISMTLRDPRSDSQKAISQLCSLVIEDEPEPKIPSEYLITKHIKPEDLTKVYLHQSGFENLEENSLDYLIGQDDITREDITSFLDFEISRERSHNPLSNAYQQARRYEDPEVKKKIKSAGYQSLKIVRERLQDYFKRAEFEDQFRELLVIQQLVELRNQHATYNKLLSQIYKELNELRN